jgi:acetyl-CoA acetyltransferase family protein
MPEAVILSALRTPVGTAYKGTLRDTTAFDLADHVIRAAADGLDPERVDDVILAEGLAGGGVIARHAAITAGLQNVPGLALNRHCAASLSAVATAAGSIRSGMDELVIAGGVSSGSTAPRERVRAGEEWTDWFSPTHPDRPDAPNRDMSLTIGWSAAVTAGVSREEMDAWALRSHRNAIRAIDEGRFKEEIVPIETPHGLFSVDEHPRRDTSMEKLGRLKVLHPEIEGFSITAGNACGSNDGAAALVIASDTMAAELGRPPPCAWPACGSSRSTRRRSTSTAAAARSVTPLPRPAAGCSARSSTSSAARAGASASPRCAPAAAWAVPRSSKFSRPNSYSVLPAAGVMRGIRWPGPGKSRSPSTALILQPFTEHDDDADG